jgi:TetR/AcrR family tetracycline transcriptional repressor
VARVQRTGIVDAAVVLLDEVGLDALTTRLLADRLGVQVGALYWHVRNKRELLVLVADRIVAEAIPDSASSLHSGWQVQVVDAAQCLRAAMLHHRDGARLVAAYAADAPASLELAEAGLRAMQALGLDLQRAAFVGDTLVSYVTGFVLQEQTMSTSTAEHTARRLDDFPNLAAWNRQQSVNTRDQAFAAGLALIVSGIRTLLEA